MTTVRTPHAEGAVPTGPSQRTTGEHPASPGATHRLARLGLLRELDHPGAAFATITPNWFASVMGTGIVAVAAARLPAQVPGLHAAATAVWFLAVLMLIGLSVATCMRWVLFPKEARAHHVDPVMAHFYGAVPMAFLTVGAATLLVGGAVVGQQAATDIDWVLWTFGTVVGLVTAIAIPYLLFTRLRVAPDSAFGGWLMPIVAPMVSASTGALLLPHAAVGEGRTDLLYGCYVLFGVSLFASLIVITMLWIRLTQFKIGEARLVPTLWIVLGPLGQSITAANLLGANAHLVLPGAEASVFKDLGIAYGLPMLGFAVLWASIAAGITIRTALDHLPFSLTWWSFTFPVGTVVTGLTALAAAAGSAALRAGADATFVALVGAWVVVAVRTAHDSVTGRIFRPPVAPDPLGPPTRPTRPRVAVVESATADRTDSGSRGTVYAFADLTSPRRPVGSAPSGHSS